MTRDDIIRMAREAGFEPEVFDEGQLLEYREEWHATLERFAQLVAAAKDAEHKEAMRWDIHSCGPTCKRYACVMTREAVAAEREACAKVCETGWKTLGQMDAGPVFAKAIRARGQQ